MCLSVLSFQQSAKYPFLFIHNRDEFHDRISQPAHYWNEHPGLLGGEDLKSKGMWLGVNTQHSTFAGITNFRDPKRFNPNALSRGFVVRDFLKAQQSTSHFCESLHSKFHEMNLFNLLFGTFAQPYFYSSRTQELVQLSPGLYGLSNATLDSPWPKVEKSKSLLRKSLPTLNQASPETLTQTLFEILSDTQLADPANVPQTGLSPAAELALSSIFVKTHNYGTVSSSVLFVDHKGDGHFYEKAYTQGNSQFLTQEFHWKVR